jgi:hypothetical protein
VVVSVLTVADLISVSEKACGGVTWPFSRGEIQR